MTGRLKSAELRHALGIEFFRDQIEANKVIQRGLHRYWDEHPEEFPSRHPDLAAELRPQLDIVNRHMLLLLIRMENMPPVRRSHIDDLFDRKLRKNIALRQLGELRRDAAGIALRSLYSALVTSRPALASLFPDNDHRRPFMVMTNTKTAVPASRNLDAMSRHTATTPAYYLGRSARVWIAAFRRGSFRTKNHGLNPSHSPTLADEVKQFEEVRK